MSKNMKWVRKMRERTSSECRIGKSFVGIWNEVKDAWQGHECLKFGAMMLGGNNRIVKAVLMLWREDVVSDNLIRFFDKLSCFDYISLPWLPYDSFTTKPREENYLKERFRSFGEKENKM